MSVTFIDRLELGLWVAVPLTGLVLVACGGARGADPDEIQAHLDDVVVPIVDDTSEAFAFLGESEMLGSLQDGLGAARMGTAFGADPAPDVPGGEGEGVPEPVDPNEPTAGEELSRFLREVIFTNDNYEGDGVYRIRGRDVCPQEGESPDPVGEPAPPEDPVPPTADCEQMVDDMELRIEVLVVDDGFDATLLVGPHHSKPVRLESRDDRMTVVGNLAAAKAAIEHVASVTGTQVELPEVFEGVVAATVRRDGDAAATVSMAIREDVSIEATTEDGTVSFEAAASDPLARASIDALQRHLEIEANAGPVLASLPWRTFEPDSELGGTLRVDLAGATGTLVADDDDEAVTLVGMGLGGATSRITLDDQTLFAIDVNPEEGRTFDLTATPGQDGPTFAFEPALHVVTTIDARPVTESWDTVDPAEDGDTYTIVFDGAHPSAQALPGDDTQSGALRVVSGRLSLSVTGAEPVVVEAGQCLLDSEVVDGEHPALGGMEAGACP